MSLVVHYFGGDSRSPLPGTRVYTFLIPLFWISDDGIGFFCQGIFHSCLTFHPPNIRIITGVPAELFSGEMVIPNTKWPLKPDSQNLFRCWRNWGFFRIKPLAMPPGLASLFTLSYLSQRPLSPCLQPLTHRLPWS